MLATVSFVVLLYSHFQPAKESDALPCHLNNTAASKVMDFANGHEFASSASLFDAPYKNSSTDSLQEMKKKSALVSKIDEKLNQMRMYIRGRQV